MINILLITWSTCYYDQHFEDAIDVVGCFRLLDVFIITTCSHNWPEIKGAACIISDDYELITGQSDQDCSDLVAQIAKQNYDEIINDFDDRQEFGKVAAQVYTIQF